MYIPAHFDMAETADMIAFMRQFPFATLVTVTPEGAPFATHLPVVIETNGEQVTLLAHVARQNPQWQHFNQSDVLVIFQEPHAYVSPRWYEKTLNVPTWNYVAVHAWGKPEVLENETAILADLEKLIHQSEPAYEAQWKTLPDEYKSGMIKGIVAFHIPITRLAGKAKLSQNKTDADRQQVIHGLQASPHASDQQMGQLMADFFTKK